MIERPRAIFWPHQLMQGLFEPRLLAKAAFRAQFTDQLFADPRNPRASGLGVLVCSAQLRLRAELQGQQQNEKIPPVPAPGLWRKWLAQRAPPALNRWITQALCVGSSVSVDCKSSGYASRSQSPEVKEAAAFLHRWSCKEWLGYRRGVNTAFARASAPEIDLGVVLKALSHGFPLAGC